MNRSRVVDTILALAVLGSIVALLQKVRTTRSANAAMVVRVDSLTRQHRLTGIKASALEEVLGHVELPVGFAVSDSIFAEMVKQPGGVLVYWMSPNCPSCRVNYPALTALSQQFPGRIIALSPDGVASVSEEYARMNIPASRMTREMAGPVFPASTFPTTLILRDGRRAAYLVGRINSDSIARLFSKWQPGVKPNQMGAPVP